MSDRAFEKFRQWNNDSSRLKDVGAHDFRGPWIISVVPEFKPDDTLGRLHGTEDEEAWERSPPPPRQQPIRHETVSRPRAPGLPGPFPAAVCTAFANARTPEWRQIFVVVPIKEQTAFGAMRLDKAVARPSEAGN